jgi:hypothetical protein
MLKTLLGGVSALTLAALSVTAPAQAAGHGPNIRNCDTTIHGKVHNVTIQAGSSCTLAADATVTGGVHAKKGAANLTIRTNVARNIMARGVTGTVIISTPGCKFDPLVGNNVKIQHSHNVLICDVTSKNNIAANGEDGQVTIRDSHAGNNIFADRERAYVGPPLNSHRHPEWVRLLRDTAGNHIFELGDSARVVVNRDDSPTPVQH